jgi:hypothetical protein
METPQLQEDSWTMVVLGLHGFLQDKMVHGLSRGPKLVVTDSQRGQSKQGFASAISANGNTAVVGGFAGQGNTGAVWIFALQSLMSVTGTITLN